VRGGGPSLSRKTNGCRPGSWGIKGESPKYATPPFTLETPETKKKCRTTQPVAMMITSRPERGNGTSFADRHTLSLYLSQDINTSQLINRNDHLSKDEQDFFCRLSIFSSCLVIHREVVPWRRSLWCVQCFLQGFPIVLINVFEFRSENRLSSYYFLSRPSLSWASWRASLPSCALEIIIVPSEPWNDKSIVDWHVCLAMLAMESLGWILLVRLPAPK